jgi:hypothetical protein
MKPQKMGLLVASVIFMLVGLGHLSRFVRPFQVMIGSHSIGPMLSLAVAVVAIALSVWLGMLACACDKKEEAPAQPKA